MPTTVKQIPGFRAIASGNNGILVELVHAPGGGMQTATFQQQT